MTEPESIAQLQALGLRVVPRVRMIEVNGRRTVLDHRSFAVFLALAGRIGDCLTKEELLRAAWPRQVVHENSLAKAISKIRQAINGSAIEIVAAYGLGYVLRKMATPIQLSRDIALTSSGPVDAAIAEVPGGRPRGKANSAGLILLLLVTVVVAGMDRSQVVMGEREPPLITHDPPDAIATILWVDDHPTNNAVEVAEFKKRRIAVHLAETTDDALKLVAMNHYDLLISDLGRGEDRLAGLKMTEAIRGIGKALPVVIYTVRPKDLAGQEAQRKMVADAGATTLAVTPNEVRAEVLRRLSVSH